MADLLAGLAGAGLGAGISQARKYSQKLDPDKGTIYRKAKGKAKKARGKSYKKKRTSTAVVKGHKRVGRKKVRFTKKGLNGNRKRVAYKNKPGVAKFSKQVQRNLLFPNCFKVTNYVGTISNTIGSGSDVQLGNMKYRLTNASYTDDYAQWEIWRMTSLAKTFNSGEDAVDTPLSVGTNSFTSSSTQADIISGVAQSKCLSNVNASQELVQTNPHYTRCNGTPNFDLNPNYLISGFNINLQFLSFRQCKQQLCVRLVRIKNQALEDCWGQSRAGSATKTLDIMCGMVNSTHHIDPNEYEVLYECKTIIPGFNPGASHPKQTTVKKYLPVNYMMTQSKKKYHHDLTKWGGQFSPYHVNDTSYFNQVFLTWMVRPIQGLIMATRTDQQAPNLTGGSNLEIIDSFAGAGHDVVRGKNTSARVRVNGTLTTYGRCQAVKRLHS